MTQVRFIIALAGLISALSCPMAAAEDGHRLWLRYDRLEAGLLRADTPHLRAIYAPEADPLVGSARQELRQGTGACLGRSPPLISGHNLPAGTVMILTRQGPGWPDGLKARLRPDLRRLGPEGFVIQSLRWHGRGITVIAGADGHGALYGTFRFLSLMRSGARLDHLNLSDAPKLRIRILNHWDNPDGTVERGYAGRSIWNWGPWNEADRQLYRDYGRANASVGINGAVLNNVNAKAVSLSRDYLKKTRDLADALRPWGMRVYLSARFTAPIELGGLKTADPLDPAVIAWWRAKIEEIYGLIPDFGGFLVKASSEGQPGPGDYGRTHADGANMLARLVAPHQGVVIWRAFVYSDHNAEDRARQAFSEFKPLDGAFDANVAVQIKNGPIDFQPREPFHPLFGAMPATHEALEVQITKEYLGQRSHIVYLGPLYAETLRADTGTGKTVSQIIEGSPGSLSIMAGVANIGRSRTWSGSHFNQANWYAFGRLAWDPEAEPEAIARDWLALTFSRNPEFVRHATTLMMASRQAVVDYMTPLGLTHQMATRHHYGPGPWVCDLKRPEWNPCYYARADKDGIGFERTASGSNALSQYAPEAARRLASSEEDLLWFHHVGWTDRLSSGETVWVGLVHRYDRGVAEVGTLKSLWAGLRPYVDAERFAAVTESLVTQSREARWWRDASVSYFQSKSGLPLPPDAAPPEHGLDYYQALQFDHGPDEVH